jgi:hypothetical protein
VRSKEEPCFKEENCGILGGSHVAFLRHYAHTAMELVLDPRNAAAWARFPEKAGFNMIVEQFLLSACLEFHRFHPRSPYRGVRIRHLFPSLADAFDSARATRAGFTHLLGDAKSSQAVGRRLEERVRREDPAYLRRCERVLAGVR